MKYLRKRFKELTCTTPECKANWDNLDWSNDAKEEKEIKEKEGK